MASSPRTRLGELGSLENPMEDPTATWGKKGPSLRPGFGKRTRDQAGRTKKKAKLMATIPIEKDYSKKKKEKEMANPPLKEIVFRTNESQKRSTENEVSGTFQNQTTVVSTKDTKNGASQSTRTAAITRQPTPMVHHFSRETSTLVMGNNRDQQYWKNSIRVNMKEGLDALLIQDSAFDQPRPSRRIEPTLSISAPKKSTAVKVNHPTKCECLPEANKDVVATPMFLNNNTKDHEESSSPLTAKNLDHKNNDAGYGSQYAFAVTKYKTPMCSRMKSNVNEPGTPVKEPTLSRESSKDSNNSTTIMGVSPLPVLLQRAGNVDKVEYLEPSIPFSAEEEPSGLTRTTKTVINSPMVEMGLLAPSPEKKQLCVKPEDCPVGFDLKTPHKEDSFVANPSGHGRCFRMQHTSKRLLDTFNAVEARGDDEDHNDLRKLDPSLSLNTDRKNLRDSPSSEAKGAGFVSNKQRYNSTDLPALEERESNQHVSPSQPRSTLGGIVARPDQSHGNYLKTDSLTPVPHMTLPRKTVYSSSSKNDQFVPAFKKRKLDRGRHREVRQTLLFDDTETSTKINPRDRARRVSLESPPLLATSGGSRHRWVGTTTTKSDQERRYTVETHSDDDGSSNDPAGHASEDAKQNTLLQIDRVPQTETEAHFSDGENNDSSSEWSDIWDTQSDAIPHKNCENEEDDIGNDMDCMARFDDESHQDKINSHLPLSTSGGPARVTEPCTKLLLQTKIRENKESSSIPKQTAITRQSKRKAPSTTSREEHSLHPDSHATLRWHTRNIDSRTAIGCGVRKTYKLTYGYIVRVILVLAVFAFAMAGYEVPVWSLRRKNNYSRTPTPIHFSENPSLFLVRASLTMHHTAVV